MRSARILRGSRSWNTRPPGWSCLLRRRPPEPPWSSCRAASLDAPGFDSALRCRWPSRTSSSSSPSPSSIAAAWRPASAWLVRPWATASSSWCARTAALSRSWSYRSLDLSYVRRGGGKSASWTRTRRRRSRAIESPPPGRRLVDDVAGLTSQVAVRPQRRVVEYVIPSARRRSSGGTGEPLVDLVRASGGRVMSSAKTMGDWERAGDTRWAARRTKKASPSWSDDSPAAPWSHLLPRPRLLVCARRSASRAGHTRAHTHARARDRAGGRASRRPAPRPSTLSNARASCSTSTSRV